MSDPTLVTTRHRWTASEVRRLPEHERNAVLEAAATAVEAEYRSNPDLTDFEAFGKEDLHGDSADAETR